MKITYCGTEPVDTLTHDGVVQGDTIDVPDDIAASLLDAGTSYADDGTVVARPESPLWRPASEKAATSADITTDAAAAGKD